MKHSKTKKTLLGVGTALMAPAITMLVRGQTLEGGILLAMSVGMVVLYDQLDDKAKAEMPSGVDEQTMKEIAELGAEGAEAVHDYVKSRKK
ncbi:hypothetical protein M1M34_gp033 [Haloarcula tailed virus 2]|uniref:Uncharacterized protein n=1 Tax=Haloarcula tailed virus 2 TaxID=2877989 RepID=A0AAE9BYR8_9CAUD|nr:hypothetical protein M1M34_gp033 [Haloarcula tailed virus 2]UBF23184.1 hypothetical protein HATV-2_gp33 [Haloarcula tailed virus 2]